MQWAGGEGSTMAGEVSTATPCTWLSAWMRGAELTTDRLHGLLCRENGRLERQRLLLMSTALVSLILYLTSQW